MKLQHLFLAFTCLAGLSDGHHHHPYVVGQGWHISKPDSRLASQQLRFKPLNELHPHIADMTKTCDLMPLDSSARYVALRKECKEALEKVESLGVNSMLVVRRLTRIYQGDPPSVYEVQVNRLPSISTDMRDLSVWYKTYQVRLEALRNNIMKAIRDEKRKSPNQQRLGFADEHLTKAIEKLRPLIPRWRNLSKDVYFYHRQMIEASNLYVQDPTAERRADMQLLIQNLETSISVLLRTPESE